jgi:succinoglycan biosynthesis transport protein ExoP
MQDQRVLMDALRNDQLQSHLTALGEDPLRGLGQGLSVGVVRGTNLISVAFSGPDRRLCQAAVNAVLDAYFRIYGPNAETQHTRTTQQLRGLITDTRRRMTELEQERERVIRNSIFGVLDAGPLVTARLETIASLQEQIRAITELRTQIEQQAAAEGRSVRSDEVAPPAREDLYAADPGLVAMRDELESARRMLADFATRFSEQHPTRRQVTRRVESLEGSLKEREEVLLANWAEQMAPTMGYAALGERFDSMQERLGTVRRDIDRFNQERARVAAIDTDIRRQQSEMEGFQRRLAGLETESEAIRQGRVTIRAMAQVPTSPSRDRRIQYGAAGFMGGFGASLFLFFLIGSVDRRAFGARQLEADRGRLRPLGVVPDMGRLGDSDEERILLEDCIHRVRNRIDVRRRHADGGYAIKVSSPLQGNNKTSVVASLGWSYAQAGYRTILVDADFIGRALSHQFGLLRETGMREALRDPRALATFVRSVRPNLDMIPAGADRSVSAGHLQPTAVKELIDELRQRYEIVLIDSGPMSASVESLPLIGAVDGVVLVLRRGRNRNRLLDCIEDIRHVGAEYLGVVLNYASLADCQRYSSLSRVSSEVATAEIRKRLGELLVEAGEISEAQLEAALAVCRASGRRLGEALVETGAVGQQQVTQALARQADGERTASAGPMHPVVSILGHRGNSGGGTERRE